MRTLYAMCHAGMVLTEMIKTVKDMDIDFDTRAYLTDQLETLFYSIQSDITMAVQAGTIAILNGDDEDDL